MTRLLLLLLLVTCPALAKTYKVYFLGGQSNMEGFGVNQELPAALRAPLLQVPLFQGNPVGDFKSGGGLGVWQPLQPGYGRQFSSDGLRNRYSDFFGPELSFGHRIAALNGDQHVALIKYALGGSALGYGVGNNWFPDYRGGNGINQYDQVMNTLSNAFRSTDIDGDGEADQLMPAGIIWMQGESDAYHSESTANRYLVNLSRLMELLRAAFRAPDLPVVLGKITDSGMDPDDGLRMNWGAIVQQAQADFVKNDRCAALVTVTEQFSHLADGWHYRSVDYIALSEAFAQRIAQLEKRCSQQ